MPKEEVIRVNGRVVKALPNATFQVAIIDSQDAKTPPRIITAHIAGKMRMNFIRIIPGDEVTVELSPYDPQRGRIVFRLK